MREKIHTSRVIVVEGKYDASRLAGITDATILCTDGFGIYTDTCLLYTSDAADE